MILPSARAILLAVLLAPLGLAIGIVAPAAWIVSIALIALLVAALMVDAIATPAIDDRAMSLVAPAAVPVGKPVRLVPLVPERGIEHMAELEGPVAPIHGQRLAFDTPRRGAVRLTRIWARRAGPLGLTWRMRSVAADQPFAVVPDIRLVRDQGLRQFQQTQRAGQRRRTDAGDGTEFQALTDFQPGMARRSIDWKSSARLRTLLAREYHPERDNLVVLAIDSGRVMSEPMAGVPRIDRAVSAALLSAFVALKAGDLVRLVGFGARLSADSGTQSGTRGFAKLHRAAATIDYGREETNFTLALLTLDQRLDRRALILIFTEFTDPTAAELMLASAARLLKRHRVLFVLFDDVELEATIASRPVKADDVVRAATAATLLRERRIVIQRLRRMGAEVVEGGHDRLALDLVDRYVRLKERA